MKITEDVRKIRRPTRHRQEEALKKGMEAKSKELVKGVEVFAKVDEFTHLRVRLVDGCLPTSISIGFLSTW